MLDRYLAKTGFTSQQTDRPEEPDPPENLWHPADGPDGHDFGARGEFTSESIDRSAAVGIPASRRPGVGREPAGDGARHAWGTAGQRVSSRERAARAVGIGTGLAGGLLVLRPRQVAANMSGAGWTPPAWIVRFLGGRYLAQGAAETRWPTRDVLQAARAVDVLHALTIVAALAEPRYRKAAGASLVLALTSAAAATTCLERSRR